MNDERPHLDLDSDHADARAISFWKIIHEDGAYSYGTLDPQGGGQLALDLLIGFVVGMFFGMIALMVGMFADWD